MALVAVLGPAAAEEPRYRILFAEHAAEPIASGEAGAHNTAEVKRIVGAMRVLAPVATVRFIFVSPRAGTCGPGCAPEHLMWQRVNAATAALRSEAVRTRSSLPFQHIGWSFLDELQEGTTLPPSSGATSGIDLRLHQEAPRPSPCPWRVLVHDPALPPVLGARDGEPALPVPPGKAIGVSAGARVAIGQGPRNAGQALAVWQNAQGEPSKVEPSVFASGGTPLPSGATRLVLLDPTGAEGRSMLSRLNSGTRDYASHDRGVGDHVGPAPPALQPAQTNAAARCEVEFRQAEAK